ncbi:MAG: hypothetical protein HY547_03105 [Elusimicrobia bacterium]|nr:hypothetical protein [Elusimicrobiota bacterium]
MLNFPRFAERLYNNTSIPSSPATDSNISSQNLGKAGHRRRLFLIAAVIYFYFTGGYFGNSLVNSSADLAIAIVDDRSLQIDAYSINARADVAEFNGHWYSGAPPGMAFLLVPIYAAIKAPLLLMPSSWLGQWDRMVAEGDYRNQQNKRRDSLLPSAFIFDPPLGMRGQKKRGTVVLLVFMGTVLIALPLALACVARVALVWSNVFPEQRESSDLLTTILLFGSGLAFAACRLYHNCVAAGFVWLVFAGGACSWQKHIRPGTALTMGLLLGMAPALDYPAALYAAIAGLYFCVSLPAPSRMKTMAFFAIGASIPLCGLLWYHHEAFGYALTNCYQIRIRTMDRALPEIEAGARALLPNIRKIKGALLNLEDSLFLYNPFLLFGFLASLLSVIMADGRRRRVFWFFVTFMQLAALLYYFSIPISIRVSASETALRYTAISVPFTLLAIAPFLAGLHRRLKKRTYWWICWAVAAPGIPIWMSLFYSAESTIHFPALFLNLGPTPYVLFKAHEAGILPVPVWILSWTGLVCLLVVSMSIWYFRRGGKIQKFPTR